MNFRILPQSKCSGHGVIAVHNGEDTPDELIDVEDLVEMLVALLHHLQHQHPQEICAATEGFQKTGIGTGVRNTCLILLF